jgi:hypothetical protein
MAASCVTALPEFWNLVAEHSGLVGAWRLTGVCRASRVGAKDWLRTLPRLLVCGGYDRWGNCISAMWRLDLGELRWEQMSDLGSGRGDHACCTVRGGTVLLGGDKHEEGVLASVEVLRYDSAAEELAFTDLPPLSCGPRFGAIALPIEESESTEGKVLLLGGFGEEEQPLASSVLKVDLATGVCTPQPPLLCDREMTTAARLPDGRAVCAGGLENVDESGRCPTSREAEVLEPPEQGSPDDAWR